MWRDDALRSNAVAFLQQLYYNVGTQKSRSASDLKGMKCVGSECRMIRNCKRTKMSWSIVVLVQYWCECQMSSKNEVNRQSSPLVMEFIGKKRPLGYDESAQQEQDDYCDSRTWISQHSENILLSDRAIGSGAREPPTQLRLVTSLLSGTIRGAECYRAARVRKVENCVFVIVPRCFL